MQVCIRLLGLLTENTADGSRLTTRHSFITALEAWESESGLWPISFWRERFSWLGFSLSSHDLLLPHAHGGREEEREGRRAGRSKGERERELSGVTSDKDANSTDQGLLL